jgi:hypothetical protein
MDIDFSKLSDEDLDALSRGDVESLSDEALVLITGATPAAAPSEAPKPEPEAPATKRGFFDRPVMMRPDEYGERFYTQPEAGPSLREAKEKGSSAGLGITGGLLDIATGIAGLGGENAVTRWLREKERELASKAESEAGYEVGKIAPQVVPALGTAKLVSKIPAAGTTSKAVLQSLGQAGQAYVVTPSAVEGREQPSIFDLGPRESAAVLEGGLGLAGELIAPGVRAAIRGGRGGVDFARSMRDQFEGRIRGVPTTPVTEEQRAALEIAQRRGVTDDEAALTAAETAAQARKAELDALRIKQTEATVAREKERQDLLAQKKAAEEAEVKALSEVELTPTRGKQELGQRLRDSVMAARKKYMDARNQAIGKFESGDEVPVFLAAKDREATGEFISKTSEFKNLVKFLRERGVGRKGKSELDREEIKSFRNVLRDITPKQRAVEEVIDEAGNVTRKIVSEPVDITFEKLVKLRRRIASGDTGTQELGFKAITGKTRDRLLEKIDDVLEDFSPGYTEYKKAYSEASEPLDFLRVNAVGKKASDFQRFSQEDFQANPEAVLDALLNNPSKTNADNLLNFVGNEGKDDIEQVVLEALVNKAGGKAAGYKRVLERYDDFLEAFPSAKKRLQDESVVFEKATGPARVEFERAIAGLERIKGEKLSDTVKARIARAEFQKANAIRVSAKERVSKLQELDADTLVAISEAANKVPLNTSAGLAQAAALATIAGGAGLILADSPLAGLLAIVAGSAGSKAAKNAFAKRREEVSNRIETEVKKIIASRSGERAASIQRRIDNENGIMEAQRIANEALKNLGFKPGTGAITANTIYKAFAVDEGASAEQGEKVAPAGEEGVTLSEEGEPEVSSNGAEYNLDSIISNRGAENLAPLIRSIYEQESSSGRADTSTENYAGAKGPMQVTRDTFEGMRAAGMIPEDYSFDNQSHLAEAGVALIQDLARRYGNDPEKIAAAYYGGPRAVTESGIRRMRRDPKNPKAPTVGEYADQVLSRVIPEAQAAGMARGGVVRYSPREEALLRKYAN